MTSREFNRKKICYIAAVAILSSAEIISDLLYAGSVQTKAQQIIFLSDCEFRASQMVLGTR